MTRHQKGEEIIVDAYLIQHCFSGEADLDLLAITATQLKKF